MSSKKLTFTRGLASLLGWTRHSSILLSVFFLTIGLILYVWRPLAEEALAYVDWSGPWWLYMDWLLIGIFLFMSLAIISHADLRIDAWTILVATFGGLVIESWGTQTNLWHYYTAERPPLWIIPAWPIATLTINRLTRLCSFLSAKIAQKDTAVAYKILYWIFFPAFFAQMLFFVAPTFDKPYTLISLLLVALLILTPSDRRTAVLTFIAGAALGYFLELWGTTRECWTYYTAQTPPFFAVLAHGMAAVAFWRSEIALKKIVVQLGAFSLSIPMKMKKER